MWAAEKQAENTGRKYRRMRRTEIGGCPFCRCGPTAVFAKRTFPPGREYKRPFAGEGCERVKSWRRKRKSI